MRGKCDDLVTAFCRLRYCAAAVVAAESPAKLMNAGFSLLWYGAAFGVNQHKYRCVKWSGSVMTGVAAFCRLLRYFSAAVVAAESPAKMMAAGFSSLWYGAAFAVNRHNDCCVEWSGSVDDSGGRFLPSAAVFFCCCYCGCGVCCKNDTYWLFLAAVCCCFCG
jgi:hypothetical protein